MWQRMRSFSTASISVAACTFMGSQVPTCFGGLSASKGETMESVRAGARVVSCRVLVLLACALSIVTSIGYAYDGTFDETWGEGGRLILDVGKYYSTGRVVATQPDGKVVLAGVCGVYDATFPVICVT